MTNLTSTTTQPPKPPVALQLQRIYTRGVHFETYRVASKGQTEPTFQLATDVSTVPLENNQVEVTLTLTLTAYYPATNDADKPQPIWHLQFQQAGVYGLGQLSEIQREPIIYQFCANQLYQYASVYAATLVQQAGFPPVILMPIDFLGAYREQVARNASQDSATEKGTSVG